MGRALLIGLACAAFLVRIPSIAQPLGIDQSLWATAVLGMDHGQRLYADVWEQRPPGIYLSYWAAFKVFGWTPAAIAWLDILASAITTLALYSLALTLAGRTAAAVTVAIFATMTVPAWMTGRGGFLERSVCETFIMSSVAMAALCGARARATRSTIATFAMGLFLGAAVVYKPNAALYFPAIVGWSLLQTTSGIPRSFLIAGAGAAVIPLLALLWLWRIDVLDEAKIAVIDFNRWYVSAGFDVPVYVRDFADRVFLRFKTEPLWFAGIVASLAALWQLIRRRSLEPLPALALAWGAAAVVVIVVNGARLFNTYFLQALAPLALAAGWWIATWWTATRPKRVAVSALLAVSAVVLVQRGYATRVWDDTSANLAELTGRSDRTAFLDRFGGYAIGRGYSARAHEEVAAYVRSHTTPDDRIYVVGINGAGIPFLSDRLSAHRFLRVNFFLPTEFPDPRFTLDAVVRDLADRRPAYLIFERLHAGSDMPMIEAVDGLPENPAVQPLLAGYTKETVIEDFTLYRRR